MRIKKNFILRSIADEYLLIPSGEAALSVKGLIAMTESGGLLCKKLQNDCTRDDLIAMMLREYDVTAEVAGKDVDEFLEQMRQMDMLEE